MRTLIFAIAMLAACSGDTPSTKGRACTGNTYDPCLDEHNCTSMTATTCRNYATEGFQVCTQTCTPGGSACPKGVDGQSATCDENGFCKPVAANDCTPQ